MSLGCSCPSFPAKTPSPLPRVIEMGGWRQHSEGERGQSGRPLRNRCYRRIFQDNHQTKRLFTPEIKRFLKGWLVRRRKNPYPNRTEKKELAIKTGLTYIQICNWFANWRRKLKNSSHNSEDSWGHLIKDYNNKAKGNVEQFSISSDDSIWDENAYSMDSERNSTIAHDYMTETDHCYYTPNNNNNNEHMFHYISKDRSEQEDRDDSSSDSSQKRDEPENLVKRKRSIEDGEEECGKPVLLSKWLESAARYTGKDRYVPWAAYNVTWESGGGRSSLRRSNQRHREELDAAEALTFLSVWPVQPPHKQTITGH